jgi:hypothetical protein
MKLLGLRLHKAALVWKFDHVHGEGPCERERNNYHFAIDKRGREVLEHFEKTPHDTSWLYNPNWAGTMPVPKHLKHKRTNKAQTRVRHGSA